MRKYFLIYLVFISSFNVLADEYEEAKYASFYADQLIHQFDRELSFQDKILDSEVYMRLLAARIYLEERPEVMPAKSQINTVLLDGYTKVIHEIEVLAKEIRFQKSWESFIKSTSFHIYPSVGRDGNLTGNTYPAKTWSLTFDDGPKEGPTEQVLENLHLNNQKASFFVLLRQTNRFPDSLTNIMQDGHELALHSFNHLDLNRQNESTQEFEVAQAQKILQRHTDQVINLFRLPYGSGLRNKALRSIIAKQQMIHVFWNVDTLDWKDKNPESIFKRTVKQMKKTPNKSGIILFHDIHKQTVKASKMVMEYLNQEKLNVCTVGEMVLFLNGKEQACLK